MNYIDIYRYACATNSASIPVEHLRSKILADHPTVQEIIFYRCGINAAISRGHMVLFLDRTSPHDEEFIVASIRFSSALNKCWKRFVCCKELMHVFDPSLSKTANREQFIELLSELENNPINVSASSRFTSERYAEWQALFVLCPKHLRNKYKIEYEAGRMNYHDIATALLIPVVYIGTIIGDRYEAYHEIVVGEPI